MKTEKEIEMEVSDFLKSYEKATNSHDFNNVRPLIAPEAIYFFSNENLYGITEIENAFVGTFNTIEDEIYTISNVRWLALDENIAACVYDFHWIGNVNGEKKEGSGRGTNVLRKEGGSWVMAHEHLSKPKM